MARPLRVEYPGAFYHVINRGNAGETIFKSKSDRKRFFECLKRAVERFSIKIHTYCLMTNHYHLLVETPHPNLSKAIQWINVSYAAYFNRKRQRKGHLFQGRFKSILVDADEYLKHLSRYIHLNPVRAKIVETPGEYLWSSYSAFIGKTKAPSWLETGWLLSQIGRKKNESAKNYRDFVENIDIANLKNPEKDLVGGFILGASDFVSWVKESFLLPRSDEKEIPQLRQLKPFIRKEAIAEAVSREFGCDREWIVKKGRKKNMARDMAIYLTRELTGETCKNLGEYFDNISGAGVTVRYNHMSNELKRNRRLKASANKLRKQIVNI